MWSVILSILLFYILQLAEASNYCPGDPYNYCAYGCCNYAYGYDCCSVSVVYAWWFWFIWGLFFLLMVISCGCALRRRNVAAQRRRNVVVVRSYPGYGSTVVSPEVPQYPYSQYPQYYNPGYTNPVAQPPMYSPQPPPESEQHKPPPYNPNPTPDTQNQS